jgi:hypothetical protein
VLRAQRGVALAALLLPPRLVRCPSVLRCGGTACAAGTASFGVERTESRNRQAHCCKRMERPLCVRLLSSLEAP